MSRKAEILRAEIEYIENLITEFEKKKAYERSLEEQYFRAKTQSNIVETNIIGRLRHYAEMLDTDFTRPPFDDYGNNIYKFGNKELLISVLNEEHIKIDVVNTIKLPTKL